MIMAITAYLDEGNHQAKSLATWSETEQRLSQHAIIGVASLCVKSRDHGAHVR